MPESDKRDTMIETRMQAIELGVKEIKEQLGIITRKLNKAENKEKENTDRMKKIEEICEQYAELKKDMNEVRMQNRELKQKINKMEESTRWQERRKLKNNIEIYGIPERKNENIQEIITNLAKSAKVDISERDIEESYRVKVKTGEGRQIVVKFKRYEEKTKMIKAMKIKKPRLIDIKENPENKLIYVNEMLTKETKAVLYQSKLEARSRKWHKVWIYAGEVYIQMEEESRQIKVENIEQLEILVK